MMDFVKEILPMGMPGKGENFKVESKPTIMDYLYTSVAEFIGTAVLLFLSCMGCTMGMQGSISAVHISFTSGLAVSAVIQIFGHISGAHVNPVVTLSAFILNQITMLQVPIYIISQILGCLAGCAFQKLFTPPEYREACGTLPHTEITEWQAFGIETLLTLILVFSICAAWDNRNLDKLDSVPLKIGLVVVVLNFAASAYTGASMNPVRSFAPAVLNNNYTSHWVYWVGPTCGSLLATYTYKYAFLRNS